MLSDTLTARRLAPLGVLAAAAMVLILVPMPGSLSVVGTKWLRGLGVTIPRVDLVSEVLLLLLALVTASVVVIVR